MRVFYVHDMLGGSDHEFLVNLYTKLLNRWPDEGGYKHYLARIHGNPDTRRVTVMEIGGSDEAKAQGVVLREETEIPAAASAAAPAAAATAAPAELATLLAEIDEMRRRLASRGPDEAQTALERAEMSLRRMRPELDALHHDLCLALRKAMQDRLRAG